MRPAPSSSGCRRSIPGCANSATRTRAGSRRRCAPACSQRARAMIVTLDGDGQNDPAFLPKLIDALDARCAARRADRRPAHRPQGVRLQDVSSRASPMPCAARFCAMARATPAAGSRRSRAKSAWRCLISMACIGSCRHWFGVKDSRSAMSTWSIGRVAHGSSNYGMWDRLWVGILDLAGVWWLIRRKKRVPEISEV